MKSTLNKIKYELNKKEIQVKKSFNVPSQTEHVIICMYKTFKTFIKIKHLRNLI